MCMTTQCCFMHHHLCLDSFLNSMGINSFSIFFIFPCADSLYNSSKTYSLTEDLSHHITCQPLFYLFFNERPFQSLSLIRNPSYWMQVPLYVHTCSIIYIYISTEFICYRSIRFCKLIFSYQIKRLLSVDFDKLNWQKYEFIVLAI